VANPAISFDFILKFLPFLSSVWAFSQGFILEKYPFVRQSEICTFRTGFSTDPLACRQGQFRIVFSRRAARGNFASCSAGVPPEANSHRVQRTWVR
jgi:hypothetical protein